MNKKVIDSISKYVKVSKNLENALEEAAFVQEFSKGEILLKKGETCNECYFILSGLIRTYYELELEDKTTDFFREDQVVTPSCYGQNTPSEITIECLEDTIACVGTPDMEEEMFEKYPELVTMSQIMGEKIMASYQDKFYNFKMLSPEERYIKLLENEPDLIQRVPQYQLASYLGIKPESLSRIRKRISQNR